MTQSGSTNPDSGAPDSYTFDVVVIGAGIIGLSIARQFLLHSDLSVAIVDASVPCPGATGAGSLLVGRSKEESDQLRNRVEQLSAGGLRAEYLCRNDFLLKEAELEVGPGGCAAFLPDDSQIDVSKTVASIEKGNRIYTSQNRYAEFYNDPAISVLRSKRGGKVDAVKTSKNMLYANKAVVVAAGCWTGPLMHKLTGESDITVNVPVQPRKGFLLVLENFKSLKLNHGVMEAGYVNYQKTSTESSIPDAGQTHLDQSLSISMTATLDAEGHLLIGSSRQFVGFNTDLDMHIIEQIWERTREFFPALRELSLQHLSQQSEVRVGLRPYMPDGKPVIGPIPSMPNLFLATGHEGAGLSMALGAAELIVDMVLGNPSKVDPTPFTVEDRCY